MIPIVQNNSSILRDTTKLVNNFNSVELNNIITQMAEAMFQEPDGIGIAAPQIGVSLQIFLVASDVLSPALLDKRINKNNGKGAQTKKISENEYLVFINASFKKLSVKKGNDVEGCLSVRGYYGEVSRSEKVIIEYYDKTGKKHQRGASGLFARVLQHEMDHLCGILFIDKAKNISKVSST
ncbi:MAG: peptide deformylase [Patescibacteria group bacterium]